LNQKAVITSLQLARAFDCTHQTCFDRFAHHDLRLNPLVLDRGFARHRVRTPGFATGLHDRELELAK